MLRIMSKFHLNREALIDFRVKAGMLQKDLAEQAGIKAPYYSEIEAGKKIPSPAVAHRIAKVLGCQVGSFFWVAPKETADVAEAI